MKLLSSTFLTCFVLAACGGTVTNVGSVGGGPDGGGPDGGDATANGVCCKIDDKPASCMEMGGYSADGICRNRACDFPANTSFRRVKDDHGCDVWRTSGISDAGVNPEAPFACGDKTCNIQREPQYCLISYGGVSLRPEHSCATFLPICYQEPTCECIRANDFTAGTCVEKDGHVEVSITVK